MLRGPLAVLRYRDFRFLTLATSMSQFGDRLTHMLIATVIGQQAPGSFFAYSRGALVFVVPTLLLSPVAGVLVDRWSKRLVLSRTHQVQTAVLLAAGVAMALTRSFVPFWIALFVFFGLDILNNTAAPALMPALVPEGTLIAANAANLTLARVATILGMVLGGFLIRWTGWRYGMMVDASCHYVASLLALGIAAGTAPGPATGRAGSAAGPLGPAVAAAAGRFFRELGEVIGLVFRNRTVAFVLASIGVTSFVSAGAYTVLLRLIQQDLGLGTAGIGVFTGILAVGMVGGAAVIGFFPRLDRVRIVVAVLLLYGVLFVLGPWFMTIWFLALVAVLAGVAFSWLGVVQTAMLQESVAPEVRGRIFSSREFITNAVFLVTTLILGAVGDLVPLRTVLRGIGAALIVTGIAGLLWTRSIGRQDRA